MIARSIVLGLLAAITISINAAPVPKVEKTIPEKLVGRWKLVKSNGKAITEQQFLEFTENGRLISENGTGDSGTKIRGYYKIIKDTIVYDLIMFDCKWYIKTLTDEELTTANHDGDIHEYKRAREKKD